MGRRHTLYCTPDAVYRIHSHRKCMICLQFAYLIIGHKLQTISDNELHVVTL